MNKEIKFTELEQYCFDLSVKIIGSDLSEVNRVANILYREFEDNKLTLNEKN